MVGNHHRLAVEGFRQHCRQPVAAGSVQPDGILRGERLTVVLNDGEIRHLLPCLLHGEELVSLTEQAEVRPQDAAEKPHAIDYYLIIVQNLDVCRCLLLQLVDQGNVVVIELVVPRHVDHGPVREADFRPAQTFHPHTDVACQYHNIRIRYRWYEVFELDVQVIQDM